MTVTAIEEYSKSKYRIFLNDEFAFVLYKGELRKYGIAVGEQLGPDVLAEITGVVLVKRARLRAMNLLKSRDYTEKALYTKLRENQYPEEVIRDAVDYVKGYGYIDDERYAESYVRYKRGQMSNREIIRRLREKGIDDNAIENAIAAEKLDSNDEEELIRRLICKKCKCPSELDYKEKNKLLAYMYRKGIMPEQVEAVLATFT